MTKPSRKSKVVVLGGVRTEIAPVVLLQVLLSIADDMGKPATAQPSPDVFEAAIEDLGAPTRARIEAAS